MVINRAKRIAGNTRTSRFFFCSRLSLFTLCASPCRLIKTIWIECMGRIKKILFLEKFNFISTLSGNWIFISCITLYLSIDLGKRVSLRRLYSRKNRIEIVSKYVFSVLLRDSDLSTIKQFFNNAFVQEVDATPDYIIDFVITANGRESAS